MSLRCVQAEISFVLSKPFPFSGIAGEVKIPTEGLAKKSNRTCHVMGFSDDTLCTSLGE